MGGNKRAKQFFQKHTDSARKKKSLGKSAKNVFYINTNIATKKWGEKRAKQFFQKHTNSARKNVRKKFVGKKYEKRFSIFTRIS